MTANILGSDVVPVKPRRSPDPRRGRYGPWPARFIRPDGTPVTVWVFLRRDANGVVTPWARLDDSPDTEVELDPVSSAQIVTNIRQAWDAVGDIRSGRGR